MSIKTQIRGNCQCCGADQVVVRGYMSKHGYTVKEGWFQGVCSGNHYAPMQKDRAQTDAICASVLEQVENLKVRLAGLEAGTIKPLEAQPSHQHRAKPVPFAEAPEYFQRMAVESAIRNVGGRIKAGENFAHDMKLLADLHYGKALREVEVAPAAPAIMVGEVRDYEGRKMTVSRIDGARVYWRDANGKSSWMGSSAWRKLPLA